MTNKEKLLLNQYEKFLDLVLRDFPLDKIDEIAVKDVMGYGTTIDEKIFQIEGVREIVIKQREQGKGAEMNFNIERIFQKLFSNDEAALIVGEFQINMIIDGMTHVIPVRVSTVLEYIDDNWKVIHWHGSVAVESEDDTWHINEWKQKNEKLQRLVDEQTADLVNKNRELEIESSLERVRSVAMSMSNSGDLLKICEATFKELQKLGFDGLRNAVIHIPNDEQKYLMDYDYSEFTGGNIAKIKYGSHPIVDEYQKKIKSVEDAYFEVVIEKDQLDDWKNFRKNSGQSDDSRLDEAEALYYYLFSIGIGDIGISTFSPINDSQIKILKRFRNVFDLAYRRYNDITLAEAQAREAQIEVALEKIRSRTMAMQSSDELPEAANLLFLEVQALGIPTWSAGYNILSIDKKIAECWMSSEGAIQPPFTLYFKEEKSFIEQYNFFMSNESFLVQELSGKALEKHYEYMKTIPKVGDIIIELENSGISLPSCQINHLCKFDQGYLLFITYEPVPDAYDIFKRFTAVFEQTYTRFLDLKKAEAQAREAQLETALERVRSRSMAMHKSDELADLSLELVKQVQALGVATWFCAFNIYDDDPQGSLEWGSNGEGTFPKYRTPREGIFLRYYDAGQKGETFLINEISENECPAHYDYLCSLPGVGEQLLKMKDSGIPFPTSQIDHVAYFKYGYIIFITYEPVPESHDIFKRFAKVFEQTYTRFLDLQKAEAQAREAQIETALEKVRSMTMAMQKGEDLKEVVVLLYKELIALGVNNFVTCGYVEINEKIQRQLTWVTNPGGDSLGLFHLPLTGDDTFDERYAAWKQQQIIFHQKVAGEVRSKHLEYAITTFNSKEAEEMVLSQFPDPCIFYCFNFSHGYLHLITGSKLKNEDELLLARFTKVFEQTYARFLDLQKAEAQARETEIQLALEKVRMVALGLNKSEEMLKVAKALYEELIKLGFPNIRNAIIDINNGDGDTFTDYDYSHEMSGTITQMSYHDHPTLEGQFKKMSSTTNDFFELVLDGKELEDLKRMRIKNGEADDPRLNNIDVLTYNLYSFGNGAIGISNFGLLSEEEKSILNRFSNVFTFAYKRYNDLVSTEAQAREALIELSLERIRTQVTAMKESSELLDIVVAMRTEFVSLGYEAHYFWYMRYLPEIYEKAMTSGDGTRIGMVMTLPRHIHGDIKLIDDWEKSDEPIVVYAMDVETAIDYVNKMITLGDFEQIDPNAPTLDDIRHIGGLTFVMAKTHNGEIGFSLPGTVPDPPQESLDTLVRFAAVFDLAYRRFEDLKDSEQRNRETQIELALERSRTQSMLMQHSSELSKTTEVFHEQLCKLGVDSEFSYLWLPDEEKMEHLFWATWHEDKKNSSVFKNKRVVYSLDKYDPAIAECYTAWESGKPVHVNPVEPSGVEEYFNTWSELLEGANKFRPELYPDGLYYVDAYMKYGCFGIMTRQSLSESEQLILQRFSKEFERTYTRFLDLKKAEAQAREAQIEAALERVRSRSMAMHSSDELVEASDVMFDQMKELGIESLRIGIGTINDKDKAVEIWSRSEIKGKVENKIIGVVPFGVHPVFDNMVKAWREKKPYFTSERVGDEVKDYYKRLSKYLSYPLPKKFNKRESITTFFFKAGSLNVISLKPLKKEECDIMIRFAKVFDQTYTRFLDLKKAEAQARESEIQLALERVRARTMAMQKSNELAQTAANLFEQMEVLGIKPYRCNIAIVDNENKKIKLWSTTNHGNVIPVSSDIPFNENPVFKEMHKGWKKQKKNHTIKLVGEDRVTWTKYISKYVPFEEYKPKNINKSKLIKEAAFFNNFYFRQGYFIIHTKEEISEKDYDIIQRFANVFEQTYTRFLDLENAEIQNKIIQAENERKTLELEEARQLQLSMLPKELPQLPDLDIAVYMQTATEVGGDYYDFHVDEDGMLTAVVGDATGHGMKAGTIVTITKSQFNSLASSENILDTFSKISDIIKSMKFRQLSMCLMMLKIKGNELSLSSAAMPPVYIYRKKDRAVEEILLKGMPLGAMKNFPYTLKETKLERGDTILLLSDGLPELTNRKGEMYGYDRAKNEFHSVAEKEPEEIVSHLKNSASQWMDRNVPDDDVTFIAVKIK